MAKFPVDKLVPVHAEVSGLLFDSLPRGLPRGIYWSIEVGYEPIALDGEQLHCSLQVEWLQLGIRDWRHLEHLDVRTKDQSFEASFYTVEHDPVAELYLKIDERHGKLFRVHGSAVVDFGGFGSAERDACMNIVVNADATFTGVFVSNHIADRLGSTMAITDELGRHLDLTAFGPLTRVTNEFGVSLDCLQPA